MKTDGPFDIYDRNVMDLTEAEDIKKGWQEYTEELYKEDLHDPDNHDSVITNLEPDILECEVKWALGSITTNKGGVAFQTHPGRQASISSGSKEPRSALESRRVSLGAHWVD